MNPVRNLRNRLLTPVSLTASAVAICGILASAVSTQIALSVGETPFTVIPLAAAVVEVGIVGIFVSRAIAVFLLAVAVNKWKPRYLPLFLAGTGVFWFMIGVSQAWVMIAWT